MVTYVLNNINNPRILLAVPVDYISYFWPSICVSLGFQTHRVRIKRRLWNPYASKVHLLVQFWLCFPELCGSLQAHFFCTSSSEFLNYLIFLHRNIILKIMYGRYRETEFCLDGTFKISAVAGKTHLERQKTLH